MAKIKELNQLNQSLTLDQHQSKLQIKSYADKNNALEQILGSGEVKLRNLARQLSKSVEEQERLIRTEAELKMELQKVKYDLEVAKD